MPKTRKRSYDRQPAPGQDIDPENPPIAHQDLDHAGEMQKAPMPKEGADR